MYVMYYYFIRGFYEMSQQLWRFYCVLNGDYERSHWTMIRNLSVVLAADFNRFHLIKVLHYIQQFKDNTYINTMFTAIVQYWILEGIYFSKVVNQGPSSHSRIYIRYSTVLDFPTLCDIWPNWCLDHGSTSPLYTMDEFIGLEIWYLHLKQPS
jgi:hypothetical protein